MSIERDEDPQSVNVVAATEVGREVAEDVHPVIPGEQAAVNQKLGPVGGTKPLGDEVLCQRRGSKYPPPSA